MRRIVVVLVVLSFVAIACHPGPGGHPGRGNGGGPFNGTIDLTLDQDPACELTGHECGLPFPSNVFTTPGHATSGVVDQVAIPEVAVPSNRDGVPIDVSRQKPQRRVQPRQCRASPHPRARHRRIGPAPDHRHRPIGRGRFGKRDHRRHHGRTLAALGRTRRQRHRPRPPGPLPPTGGQLPQRPPHCRGTTQPGRPRR